jgi:cysteinyl-tRNA synthetase
MSEFDKSMQKIFDISPITTEKSIQKNKTEMITTKYNEPTDMQQDLTDAYQQSRENIQGIIDQGKEAMAEILEIAKQGQHPRSFEVYGTLLKNMVDANKELLNIQKQMRDMDSVKKEVNNTNIDQAIFVGSTEELNKLLKNNNEKKVIDMN